MKNVLASILTRSRLRSYSRGGCYSRSRGWKIRVTRLQISLRSNWLSCLPNGHRQNDTRISRRVNRSHPFCVIQRRATCPTWLPAASVDAKTNVAFAAYKLQNLLRSGIPRSSWDLLFQLFFNASRFRMYYPLVNLTNDTRKKKWIRNVNSIIVLMKQTIFY